MYFFKYIFNVKRKAQPSDIVQFAHLLFYILKTKFRRKNFEDIHFDDFRLYCLLDIL